MDRRTFLAVAGAIAGLAPSASAAAALTGPRVYVLVLDGCHPGEITPLLTPRLAALRAAGTNYPAAQGLPVLETIPNHVMMMSGVRPDRSGVPANSIFDRGVGAVRDLVSRPTCGCPPCLTGSRPAA